MGKGRFLNQKLGKRTSRRLDLLKSGFKTQQTPALEDAQFRKKGLHPPAAKPGAPRKPKEL